MSGTKKYYECHGHIFMDGNDFAAARERHRAAPCETSIRENLKCLADTGVVYFRDGGDNLGVSVLGRSMAGEYGIEYVTPLFAIHRKGRYGSIVGRGYETLSEYISLVEAVRAGGGDFIKVMVSGIMRFEEEKLFSCLPLDAEEMKALVTAAHDRGMKVMAHVNGADAVLCAAKAGVDSIEHGYYADDACLEAMAKSGCIWVPTLAAVDAFVGRDGFNSACVEQVLRHQLQQVNKASSLGVPVASGSDAGAVGVPHGNGIRRELALLAEAGVEAKGIDLANEMLRHTFRRLTP